MENVNLLHAAASGATMVLADTLVRTGKFPPTNTNFKNGAIQAAATAMTGPALVQLDKFGVKIPLEPKFANPIVTAAIFYAVGSMMGGRNAGMNTFMLSAGSALAGQMIIDTLGEDADLLSRFLGRPPIIPHDPVVG